MKTANSKVESRRTGRRNVLMMANQRKFLGSVAKYAAEHNWRITLVNDGLPPKGWRGDGALVSYSRSEAQMKYAVKLLNSDIPCVAMSCVHPRLWVPRVLPDYAASARLGAQCLKKNCYESFAFCTEERIRACQAGYRAFVKELRRLGYGADVPWFVRNELVREDMGYDSKATLAAYKKAFARLPRPLGLFCFSDAAGSNMLNAAVDAGESVPDEVGILGTNDNTIICENQVIPMSSVNPGYGAIAQAACAALDRAMSGERLSNVPVLLPPLGVSERETTGFVSSGEPLIRKAMVVMREHIGEPFGVNELANELHISESKLCRVFRERISSTPAAELKALKLKKAKSLLRSTDMTLDCIARLCGFSHSSHFANTFRSVFGETPDTWRKRWQ